MGHVWSEYVEPEVTPLRDRPSQFEPHFGFSTPRREKSNAFLQYNVKTRFIMHCLNSNVP